MFGFRIITANGKAIRWLGKTQTQTLIQDRLNQVQNIN
jgi:hypothetical protein